MEQRIIKVRNFLNKIWNAIYNNRYSNAVKEWFDHTPSYLYCEEKGFYVSAIKPVADSKVEVDIVVTSSLDYAVDFSKYNYLKKKFILSKVNRAMKSATTESIVFKWKKILTIRAKEQ